MSWFNRNGIWIHARNGSPSDVEPWLKIAENDLIKLKARTLDNEVKHFTRPGMWHIQSIFGQDKITMEPALIERGREKRKRELILPDSRFVPAFHTFDENETFIGVTLCWAGKWGPPYRFIRIKEEEKDDKIFDFEWGQWNTGDDEERPDPEIYKERAFAYLEDDIVLFEVPAAHEYCGEPQYMDYTSTSRGHYTGGPYKVIITCREDTGQGFWLRDYYWNSDATYYNNFIVHTDWLADYENEPVIHSWEYYYNEAGPYTCRDGIVDSYWIEESGPNMCELMNAELDDMLGTEAQNNTFEDGLYGYRTSNINWFVWKAWNVTGNYTGTAPYGNTLWSTFTGASAEEGIYFYGETVRNQGDNLTMPMPSCPEATFPHLFGTEVLTSWENNTAQDTMVVFGQSVQLMSGMEGNYNEAAMQLWKTNPRIYLIGGKYRIGLAIEVRTDAYSYMMFQPDANPAFSQFRDPDATYEHLKSPSRHKLGITGKVNGSDTELYANGEYSLVRIWEPNAYKEEHEIEG